MKENNKIKGLSVAEVAESRKRYGANVLTPSTKTPLWRVFLGKFRDPMIVILLVAGVLSVLISCYEYFYLHEGGAGVFFEPVGIFIAVLLATGLAFVFELKAEREFALLNKVSDADPVQVLRDGDRPGSVPRRDVVVGDIVVVNTGDELPADGRLLESTSLSVDESTLTGEPMAMKTADEAHFDAEATFPSNMLLRGTKVMEGHGIMQVTAVGDATENGKVYQAATIDNSVETPLNRQLDRLGRLLSVGAYIIAALVLVVRMTMYFTTLTFDWLGFVTYMLQSVMLAVSLVCMAVPEGLPMAVTLSLAYSMRRMLKTHNLVRRLHACETMGATTVICTDKTGTLTQNRMQVAETKFFGEPTDDIIYEGIGANSTARLDNSGDAPTVLGNPTEGALLLWLKSRGADYEELRGGVTVVAELPFSTERKFMATVVRRADGEEILYVKGAPEIVYGLCDDTSGVSRQKIDALLLGYQNKAMRTLAFAYKRLTPGEKPVTDGRLDAKGLVLLGVTAISDPVRPDVPAAVEEVLDAGIKVKIVTGDTSATAKEIARQIGLWHDDTDTEANIITGTEFAALTDEELQERVGELKIISRARPLDKKRLVEALQAKGDVVAVTGDGTNDAPALKVAHVGLSMGDGTSVAKDASDITILDNSFASIGRAVMWGRSLYRNIQRFVLFQMTVNVAGCLIMLAGTFMGLQAPLTVTQMLWINLIMDTFAAVALASLPPSESVMREKPRERSAFIITPAMTRFIVGVGGAMFVVLLGFLNLLEHNDITSLRQLCPPVITDNAGLNVFELSLFFSVFVMLQFWNMFNARAFETHRSALHLGGCQGFMLIAVIILAGQIGIVTFGGAFFGVVPLTASEWCAIIAVTSMVLWIGEGLRLMGKRRYNFVEK